MTKVFLVVVHSYEHSPPPTADEIAESLDGDCNVESVTQLN